MVIQHKTGMALAFSLTCMLLTASSLLAQVENEAVAIPQGYNAQAPAPQSQTYSAPAPANHSQTYSAPAQAQAAHGHAGHGHGAAPNPNAAILSQLQGLIDNEAHFGRTPANSRLLADLQILIGRYSFVPAVLPRVNITNRGGGVLRIVKADGSSFDLAAFNSTQAEIGPGRTTLIALGGDVNADFSLAGNVPCKIHDCDRNGGGNFELNATGARRAGGGAQRYYPFDRMLTQNKNGCYYLEQ